MFNRGLPPKPPRKHPGETPEEREIRHQYYRAKRQRAKRITTWRRRGLYAAGGVGVAVALSVVGFAAVNAGPSTDEPTVTVPLTAPEDEPTTAATAIRAVIVGDSYFGSAAPGGEPVDAQIAAAMNWDYVGDYVLGGTGYIAKGLNDRYKAFPEYAEDIIADRPDVVVIEGGANDFQFGAEALRAAATEFLQELRQALPDAELVVLGPLLSGSSPEQPLFAEALESAAKAADATFINPDSWFPGVYYSTSGPGREFVSEDRVHPSPAGVELLVREAVRTINAGL